MSGSFVWGRTALHSLPTATVLCFCRVAILNDFEAVGYGIPVLEESDIVPINMAISEPHVSGSRARHHLMINLLVVIIIGSRLTLASLSGPQGGDGPWHGSRSCTADVGRGGESLSRLARYRICSSRTSLEHTVINNSPAACFCCR